VGLKQVRPYLYGGKSRTQQSHHCGIETSDTYPAPCNPAQQQSHHCGIETIIFGPPEEPFLEQQSHHCGIETHPLIRRISSVSRSNRTIVGLKRRKFLGKEQWRNLQQSHHCGIETRRVVYDPDDDRDAAIAPLWD